MLFMICMFMIWCSFFDSDFTLHGCSVEMVKRKKKKSQATFMEEEGRGVREALTVRGV